MMPSKLELGHPRRTPSEIARTLGSFARAAFELRRVERGARVRCYGALDVQPEGRVVVGERVSFLGGPIPTSLRCARGAELTIGDRTICNYGAAIVARHGVHIGSGCMIASQVHICDDDGRRAAPITIGDGVWLAYGAVVEPGAVIGDGSVVAALAVVSGVVPPRSLVAANPTGTLGLDVSEGHSSPPRLGREVCPPPSGPTAADVRAAIIDWLDDTRCFGDASSRVADDGLSLRDAGLLDSLGLVQIADMLERRYGVTIHRDWLASPEAQSMRGLVECVVAGGTRTAP